METRPTRRAADRWLRAAFYRRFVWLEVGSVKMAFSRPTHQRVPQQNTLGQAANRWAATVHKLYGVIITFV